MSDQSKFANVHYSLRETKKLLYTYGLSTHESERSVPEVYGFSNDESCADHWTSVRFGFLKEKIKIFFLNTDSIRCWHIYGKTRQVISGAINSQNLPDHTSIQKPKNHRRETSDNAKLVDGSTSKNLCLFIDADPVFGGKKKRVITNRTPDAQGTQRRGDQNEGKSSRWIGAWQANVTYSGVNRIT